MVILDPDLRDVDLQRRIVDDVGLLAGRRATHADGAAAARDSARPLRQRPEDGSASCRPTSSPDDLDRAQLAHPVHQCTHTGSTRPCLTVEAATLFQEFGSGPACLEQLMCSTQAPVPV
jgi:hypothetical protein